MIWSIIALAIITLLLLVYALWVTYHAIRLCGEIDKANAEIEKMIRITRGGTDGD